MVQKFKTLPIRLPVEKRRLHTRHGELGLNCLHVRLPILEPASALPRIETRECWGFTLPRIRRLNAGIHFRALTPTSASSGFVCMLLVTACSTTDSMPRVRRSKLDREAQAVQSRVQAPFRPTAGDGCQSASARRLRKAQLVTTVQIILSGSSAKYARNRPYKRRTTWSYGRSAQRRDRISDALLCAGCSQYRPDEKRTSGSNRLA